MSNPRKLTWRLRQSANLTATTNADSSAFLTPDFFPSDPDEKTSISLNVSLNEFVKIASSIDAGRDIAYGDDSLKIWNIWSTSIMPIILDCDDIADCIDTSQAVQNSITNEYQSTVAQFLDDNGSINPDKANSTTTTETRLPEYSTGSIASPPVDCDLDKLWSGIREMVVRIDDKGRDVLEDLTLINDKAEQIQGLIDLVPLLGDIIADVAGFFTELVPDLLNGYNAFSSEATIDDLACELFSLVCNECRYPTYEEVLSVYSSKSVVGLIASPQLLNYTQVWYAVKQIPSLNGSIVYHTINTWQLVTYYFGSIFGGSRGTNTLNIWASIGEDLPTDNWIVLCGGCPEPIVNWTCTIDFSIDSYGAILTKGTTYTGDALLSGDDGSAQTLRYDLPFNTTVGTITEFTLSKTQSTEPSRIDLVRFFDNSGVVFSGNPNGGNFDYHVAGLDIKDATYWYQFTSVFNDNSAVFTANKIVIKGYGTPPSVGVVEFD